jgi:hypothetical protein
MLYQWRGLDEHNHICVTDTLSAADDAEALSNILWLILPGGSNFTAIELLQGDRCTRIERRQSGNWTILQRQ